MRSRAGVRFLATVTLLVVARGLDACSTWIATRDLSLETNPLTRLLHVGWGGLLLVNAAVIAFIAMCAWRAEREPAPLPAECGLDVEEFVGRYWFAMRTRRSLRQAMFWLPADRRVRRTFIGSAGATLIVAGSIAAATWNILVARGIVTGRVIGLAGFAGFWIGLALALGVSVRLFLLRAFARYERATMNDAAAQATVL